MLGGFKGEESRACDSSACATPITMMPLHLWQPGDPMEPVALRPPLARGLPFQSDEVYSAPLVSGKRGTRALSFIGSARRHSSAHFRIIETRSGFDIGFPIERPTCRIADPTRLACQPNPGPLTITRAADSQRPQRILPGTRVLHPIQENSRLRCLCRNFMDRWLRGWFGFGIEAIARRPSSRGRGVPMRPIAAIAISAPTSGRMSPRGETFGRVIRALSFLTSRTDGPYVLFSEMFGSLVLCARMCTLRLSSTGDTSTGEEKEVRLEQETGSRMRCRSSCDGALRPLCLGNKRGDLSLH